ncbi:unnamed protein product [Didymodactylos carnosus]|uniref:Reverse transcriptase domain-containing protein n=1 Tax=Didymodactylos carnosus TaxID=1234261 RepID=A0A814GHL4_9BILA|nr:unnamed protein product [Didymodactylos carnosus]CAF3768099.1 unnamed protein product [Didymodactylos carnosus]
MPVRHSKVYKRERVGCEGPVLFLLFHADMPTEIPSSQHTHMYTDDVALVIDAAPWWKSTEVITNIQKTAQQTLNE